MEAAYAQLATRDQMMSSRLKILNKYGLIMYYSIQFLTKQTIFI